MRTYTALLICLIVGCEPAPQVADRSATRESNPGGRDPQRDEQTIRDAEGRWRKSLTNRDTAAIAGFYTEDAVYAPQGSPPYRGRDSVSGRWAREFQIPGFELERTPIRIEVAESGDLANEVGSYLVHYRDRGQVREVRGTYMTAWRKSDGNWKIASYMWNRSQAEERR